MADYHSETAQIVKAARWAFKVADAIQDAGGAVKGVSDRLSDEMINTMVRNGLTIVYNRNHNA